MEASGCAMSWPPLVVSEAGCVVSHDRGETEHGNARNISTLHENASIAFSLLLVHHRTAGSRGIKKRRVMML